jgi:CheY-like chemotaxis protein
MNAGDKRKAARRTADRSRDRCVASLCHELRTPLGGVLGMANLLGQTPLDADQRAYVEAIKDCGQHLLGLVNDVLDLAKLETGRFEAHPGPVEIEKLLQGVAELLSPRAHDKGLEIAWCVRGLPPVVDADEGRLRQSLFNLAGNAVKFTQRGGVLITAEVLDGPAGRARLLLSVSDTGPGVGRDDAARIFQPFVQAHGGGGPADSTGLGLAIVDKLAAAMGGTVHLQSSGRGGGSTFRLEADFPVLAPPPAERSLGGVTVAVVTPSGVVRAAARLQVGACGGRCLGYSSLRAAASAPADAVALVDQALQTGRRRLAPIAGRPCIILLTPEQRSRIAGSRRAGFAGYLIKPLRRESLAARVLAVMGATSAAAGPVAHALPDERVETGFSARVLLAEDNPINAMLARALIEREGCESYRAKTGPEAVEAALSTPFDLILMDLRLPGLDGVGATLKLREAGVRTPIVALTADGFEGDRRACVLAGMDDFLVKPLDPAALRQLLARVKSGAFTEAAAHAKLAS